MSVFGRIRESLSRTKQQIVERFDEIVRRADAPERRSRPVDVETIEALEELLISRRHRRGGVGPDHPGGEGAVARRREPSRSRQAGDPRDLRRGRYAGCRSTAAPTVTLIVGVNGTGKTTTVGKLANLLKRAGAAAADLRGRHLSRRRRRAARDLGRRAPASTWCARAKAPIRRRWCSMRSRRRRPADAIRCWSTRPAGCTRAST